MILTIGIKKSIWQNPTPIYKEIKNYQPARNRGRLNQLKKKKSIKQTKASIASIVCNGGKLHFLKNHFVDNYEEARQVENIQGRSSSL